ncbi:hypothetical protein AciM339_1380 [Aciduliprofundum sp. MAR08-339]|uniref:RPA family protein n=1 Tax=Aciduliprofundum sp. (strain MAR08-339) TaxID=673860 RepID=UPI0002A4C1AF|nr:hypothetical protein AciM339_1380 [Aciduliprofundum sp. MAR08-339]
MREPAWRVFAAEYNSSKHYIKATEPKMPSYVITPIGAKISRLFVVGVLTEVRVITEEVIKARIADQTGAFYMLAGKFNPEARQILETVKVPQFIAVVGKVNVYNPREDLMYVSVVPERVKIVNEILRDYWVFDTARRLKIRIDAMGEALRMDEPSVDKLTSLGFSRKISEGVVLAIRYYQKINVERYMDMLKDALKHLLPEYRAMGYELPTVEEEEEQEEVGELEEEILNLIEQLDQDGKGASYEALLEKSGISEEKLDEVLLSLQEKGEIYEPYLGKFKRI